MKKFYSLIILFGLSISLVAQQQKSIADNPDAVPAKMMNSDREIVAASTNYSPEDAVFTEDFANGLDGNNELSLPWTTGGPNADLWRHDFDGPLDQWSVETGTNIPLESTTSVNGFMLYTPAEYNEPIFNETGTYETLTGWIESPSMDLTDLNSVLVDFEIYFRYCCFSPSVIHIGVSIDGGTTWSNFPAYNYGQYIEIAKVFSGTLNVTADISSVAANESDVKIRFSYNDPPQDSYGFYFLGVDDIAVYENPFANNLAVLQVMNGDVDSLWEIKNYPLEQTSEILLGAVYGNYGSATQTGVEITWDIMSGDDILQSNMVELGEVPTTRLDAEGFIVQNIDTAWINSGYTLETLGNYTIRTTITANEEEEFADNSILEKPIKVTPDLMSHDDLNNIDIEIGPRDADEGEGFLFEEIGFGTRYFVFNPGSIAYGLQVIFGESTTVGMEVVLEFYEVPDLVEDINVPGFDYMPTEFPLNEAEYIVTETDFGVPVFIPFFEPVELEVGKTYLAAVRQYDGDDELWVMGTDATDTDNSSYVRERNGDGDPYWFSRATELAVRLGFSETTAINEAAKHDLGLIVAPNPANDYTTIAYNLKEAQKVSYKLYDVNGRTIVSEDLGSQVGGVHKLNINTSNYDTGVYYLVMTVGESTVSEKIVISK